MSLIPEELKRIMLENGRTNWELSAKDQDTVDYKPVVKLFNPCGAATWLLTELDPEDNDIAFGLCDLGMGSPELGPVRISELEEYTGPLSIGIERDLHFDPDKTLSEYAELARIHQQIVT
ncbi:DUF2958 domain-containing protein [uncultured Bradyrhizobium sp.]|jgi:hypothetical protein|uniref:DUF2958 domain-containing protein n=1 Tax=uncultured Bradyrhizobium sp. TaxID=199684 RepID=UPI0026384C9B|nr:DUF2958 domain-containing protein [uncultured Bradyrhizobium sp.]